MAAGRQGHEQYSARRPGAGAAPGGNGGIGMVGP